MHTKKRVLIVASVALLAACSSGETEVIDATIGNPPGSPYEDGQPAQTVESSAEPKSGGCTADMSEIETAYLDIMKKVEADAPDAMTESTTSSYENIIKPYLNDNIEGMKVVSTLGMGALINECSIEETGPLVKGDVVSESGVKIAEFTAFVLPGGEMLNPYSFVEADTYSHYLESKQEVWTQWPT